MNRLSSIAKKVFISLFAIFILMTNSCIYIYHMNEPEKIFKDRERDMQLEQIMEKHAQKDLEEESPDDSDDRVKERIQDWQRQITKVSEGPDNKIGDSIERMIRTLEKINVNDPNQQDIDMLNQLSKDLAATEKRSPTNQAIEEYSQE